MRGGRTPAALHAGRSGPRDRLRRPSRRRKLSERPASEAQPARPSAVLAPSRVQRRGVEARRAARALRGRRAKGSGQGAVGSSTLLIRAGFWPSSRRSTFELRGSSSTIRKISAFLPTSPKVRGTSRAGPARDALGLSPTILARERRRTTARPGTRGSRISPEGRRKATDFLRGRVRHSRRADALRNSSEVRTRALPTRTRFARKTRPGSPRGLGGRSAPTRPLVHSGPLTKILGIDIA